MHGAGAALVGELDDIAQSAPAIAILLVSRLMDRGTTALSVPVR